jgi:hypothetical protein
MGIPLTGPSANDQENCDNFGGNAEITTAQVNGQNIPLQSIGNMQEENGSMGNIQLTSPIQNNAHEVNF